MASKITLSVFIGITSLICFLISIDFGMKMVESPSPIVSSAGPAGQSTSQIWSILSLVSFVFGLGLLMFLKVYWRSERKNEE